MDEDTPASHLVFLDSIRDSHLRLGYEPHITIDAAVIGKVERHLLLAWRVGLVVAVVGFDGNEEIITRLSGDSNCDGQIAAFVFLDLLAIDVDCLLTHDGFEVERHIASGTLLGQAEVLAIPDNALIVAAAAGLSRHQQNSMGCRDHLP